MSTDVYRARSNEVLLPDGRQMLVVLPSNCTRKEAAEAARLVAEGLTRRSAASPPASVAIPALDPATFLPVFDALLSVARSRKYTLGKKVRNDPDPHPEMVCKYDRIEYLLAEASKVRSAIAGEDAPCSRRDDDQGDEE